VRHVYAIAQLVDAFVQVILGDVAEFGFCFGIDEEGFAEAVVDEGLQSLAGGTCIGVAEVVSFVDLVAGGC
jgi:hypothetical protein